MIINDLLNKLDLSNVDHIKINDVQYPKGSVSRLHGDKEVKKIAIETTSVAMDESHIEYDLECNENAIEIAPLIEYVINLPNSPSYISIVINITI